MSLLRLRLLGGLSAVRSVDASPVAIQPRRLAVLALVATAGDRGIARPNVQALLWPDADEEAGRRVLNQAIYALKRDTGADDLFVDARELVLNPAVVEADLWEFEAALTAGDPERAVRAYGGPFLDGFRLPQAGDLERWIDERRSALEHRVAAALERLAMQRREGGDPVGAVVWWRALAGRDPLNGRVTLELMRDLAAAGDRAGAIQQARIYETLVASELEMAPDPAVTAFAESLRRPGKAPPVVREAPPVATEAPAPSVLAPSLAPPVAVPVAPPVEHRAVTVPSTVRIRRRWVLAGLAVLVTGIGIGALLSRRVTGGDASAGRAPLLAVGDVSDYRGGGDSTLARPLADMLATNLARVPSARVLSTARMLELMRQLAPEGTASAGLTAAAARQAGAAQLVDGAVFRLANGNFRLDLRRIDLADGNVITAYTVHGTDVFSLADSATALLARDMGSRPPAGSIADVTTRSIAAYRLYEQGLRAFSGGDNRVARPLFEAALAEDSTFAMAAYYFALSSDTEEGVPRLARAARLAAAAPERERLILKAGVAFRDSDPLALAYADTLTTRYPEEIEGHLYRGLTLLNQGENATALPSLRRVIAMDSLALRGTLARCAACEALEAIIYAYIAMDSAALAVQEARRWTELQPRWRLPWETLFGALATRGRGDEVWEAARMMAAVDPSFDRDPAGPAYRWIPMDEPASAEEALRSILAEGTPRHRMGARWYLTIALREQGRYAEALEIARRYREANPASRNGTPALPVAQALYDLGRFRAAAALFDTSAVRPLPDESPTRYARRRAWAMTLAGGALAAAGDTVGFTARIDSVRVYGARSSLCRDPLLHHHLQGLLLQRRADHEGAVAAFRRAICTTTLGYTRTNYALARSLLALGRAQEAAALLQPALRGGIEASNYYITRAELHELLGETWERLGQRDSAVAHYAVLARVWRGADAALAPRVARVRERLAALGGAARAR
ncbi:MAG TPA: BTAD domain-containing putative transcriptional regulator [Gemmatimonadaceae bacterium]|nr:BTAD domain-containing putative transcriptional regulator [Gemmatimonadaceae bacterium]